MKMDVPTLLVVGGTPDTDGDGLNDVIDVCPTQPETFNGVLDLMVVQMITCHH